MNVQHRTSNTCLGIAIAKPDRILNEKKGILHRSQKVVYTFGGTAILAVAFHRLEACATSLCYYNFVFAITWPGEKCKQEYEGCQEKKQRSEELVELEIGRVVEWRSVVGGRSLEL